MFIVQTSKLIIYHLSNGVYRARSSIAAADLVTHALLYSFLEIVQQLSEGRCNIQPSIPRFAT